MNAKFQLRMLCDAAMIVLLPLLMVYSLVGEALHEWLGIAMCAVFIIHHALNWRRLCSLMTSRLDFVAACEAILNVLLGIIMVALPLSGIVVARHSFGFLHIPFPASFARIIHLCLAYWGLILMSLHLGFHWGTILKMVRKVCHLSLAAPICKGVLRTLALLLALWGIYSFIQLNICQYLSFQTHAVFLNLHTSLFRSLASYISVMCLFVGIGHLMVVAPRLLRDGLHKN